MKYAVVLALAAAATASYLPPQEEAPSAPAEVPTEPAYNEGVPSAPVEVPSEPAYTEAVPTDVESEAPTDVVPTDAVPTDAETAVEEPTGAEEEPSYVTEVVTQYTTYCPEPTTITDGDNVITVTEPTTLTITHCPGGCTIEKPVTQTSAVVCEDGCPETTEGASPTAPPAEEGPYQPPSNGTTGAAGPTGGVPGTGPEPTEPVTAGAAKIGAGLAAFLGVVAFF